MVNPSSFRLFNVFGMLNAQRYRVNCLATAILPNGRSVERAINRELDIPIEAIPEDDAVLILFSAMLNETEKPRIAIQQVSKQIGGPDLLANTIVRSILEESIKKILS